MVNFLNKTGQVVEPPSGGGTFTPNGIVAPWMAAIMWQFFSTDILPEEYKGKAGVQSRQRGSGYWHYFTDQELAEQARTELGVQYPATMIWHFECRSADVLNFTDEAREKFSDVISYDVDIKTLASGKRRHTYHMIALPSAVYAMAKMLGYEVPEFDLNDLIGQDIVYNEDFQFKMIGDSDAKEDDENYYTNSVLWGKRADLWKALGEDDPRAFRMMSTDSGDTKFRTVSPKLSECFGIANYPWSSPTYMKVVTVNDPHVSSVYGEGKHVSVPAIYEIYESKEAAQAALAETETETSPTAEKVVSTSSVVSGLVVPVAWQGMENDWKQYLGDFKKANPNLIPPVVAKGAAELSVTEDELRAWWNAV